MKTSELRIGNIVQDRHSWIKVTSIDDDIDDDRVMPVPLTEDILVKCGFERYELINGAYSEWKFGRYRFHFRLDHDPPANNFGVQTLGTEAKSVHYFAWCIENLHQLQNLMFAITGEELNIKP